MIITRKIEIKDAPAINALTHQLGYEATIAETKERLEKILKDEQHFAYAAVLDDKITGWIHAFYCQNLESPSFVEIGGLVTHKDFRAKGIGKELIERVQHWAIGKNCNKLRVRSNMIRKDAHQFYLNRGFTETKEQKIFDKQIF